MMATINNRDRDHDDHGAIGVRGYGHNPCQPRRGSFLEGASLE